MSDIKWTEDQRNAIEARDGTVLVSAAAGSGKTAVLVRRVIEMITDVENPFNVDELLIVTFTKAAAAQMRDKISHAIDKKIAEENNTSKRNRLMRQQMLLPTAKICTIDSFCGDVVRKNYQSVDIGIDYKMLNTATEKIYRARAYSETVEKYYEENTENFEQLSAMFTTGSDDSSLENLVMSLYDISCSYPFPEKWISGTKEKIGNEKTDNKNDFAMIILKYIIDTFVFCITLANEALSVLKPIEELNSTCGEVIRNEQMYFIRMRDAAKSVRDGEGSWDELYNLINSYKFSTMRSPRGYAQEAEAVYCKTARDKYKKLFNDKIKKVMTITSADNAEDVKQIKPVIGTLISLTTDFINCFDKMKIKDNFANFSDVLHMAINILLEEKDGKMVRTNVAENYSDEFKAILIDEYQDTNEAQDMLFYAISKEGNNLFYVGDVKQSIYGFRQAMPQIFLEKRSRYKLYDSTEKSYPASIILGKNFRSRKGITDFINFTFEQIMSVETGEIEYNEFEKLYPAADYPLKEEADVYMHLIADDAETVKSEIQATHIAKIIKDMIKDGKIVSDGGEERRVKFSDFCVLLRTKKDIAEFVNVMLQNGVNAYADESGNLFEETEVKNIVSLLKIIDNPVDDIPLITVMLSPLAGFSADEISEIRLENRKGSFYNALISTAKNENKKCCDFLEMLDNYRVLASTLTPGKLIKEILSQSGYDCFVSSLTDGKLKKENLAILQKYADDFSEENNIGLSGFVRLLDKLRESNAVKSAAKSSGATDAVAVMTIHHSKGLEFPICFLAECEKKFNKQSIRSNLIAHPQSGLGIVGSNTGKMIKYETLSHLAVGIDKEKSEMSEELRVLYVAMTRAKEKLIMIMSLKDADKTIENLSVSICGKRLNPIAIRNAQSFSDMLLLSAIRYPGNTKYCMYSFLPNASFNKEDVSPLEFEKVDVELSDEEIAEDKEKITVNESLVNEIRERAEYVYPYSDLSGILAKRSASQINHNGINREFFASSRPAFMSDSGLSPAQKGTAMHLFMQHSVYENAAINIEKEISRLTSDGFINQMQADSLDREKLEKFFDSDISRRMLNSKEVYREKKFIINMSPLDFDDSLEQKFEDESVVVQGILDCAFVEDGEIVIIDYKTDRVKDEQQLVERYQAQLDVYKKAVRQCLGYNIKETVLYSFWLGKEIQI